MPKRLLKRAELNALADPALANKVRARDVCLIDIDDPLPNYHLTDQTESELLALVPAAGDIGARRDRLGPLELEL